MTVTRLKTATKLRVAVPSPEDELARLFAAERVLLDELRDVRAMQARARDRYARTHGLLMLPSLDRLRKLIA